MPENNNSTAQRLFSGAVFCGTIARCMFHKVSSKFFTRPTVQVAREFLGKYLVRRVGKTLLSGLITEVEAYRGEDDLACHASRGRTKRTEILYATSGTLYVYLIYGMHWCLNVVTERQNFPSAVLIRAVEPVEGIGVMLKNLGREDTRCPNPKTPGILTLTNGPGKLCRAFNITGDLHGKRLGRDTLWIEDRGERMKRSDIVTLPRIGVEYAKHCAKYPWRFLLKEKGELN